MSPPLLAAIPSPTQSIESPSTKAPPSASPSLPAKPCSPGHPPATSPASHSLASPAKFFNASSPGLLAALFDQEDYGPRSTYVGLSRSAVNTPPLSASSATCN